MAVEAPSNAQWSSLEGILTDLVTQQTAIRTGVNDLTAAVDLVKASIIRIETGKGMS